MESSIQHNYLLLRQQIPSGVKLIAVSKTKPVEQLLEAYEAGARAFGENYVQEIIEKHPKMPADTEWHFIGHLQSNKVKYIAPFVHWIHAVESEKLLNEINRQAEKNQRKINCLIQVHIAEEDSKFGLSPDELLPFLRKVYGTTGNYVSICGLMGMASFTDDTERIKKEFHLLKSLFDQARRELFVADEGFSQISMGMSSDWEMAVAEGSTMVRIGSNIFGARI